MFGLFGNGHSEKVFQKHVRRVANRKAQAPDRWESIRYLAAHPQPESVEALIARFCFSCDPSITDQEEKEAVVHAILEAGEIAVPPLLAAMRELPSVSWPLRCLEQLTSPEHIGSALLPILDAMDTEYERDPSKKIEILTFLEQSAPPKDGRSVSRFVDDSNETVRFHAVGVLHAIAAQRDDGAQKANGATRGFVTEGTTAAEGKAAGAGEEDPHAAIQDALKKVLIAGEESRRVKTRMLELFADQGWPLGPDAVSALKQSELPEGFRIDAKGRILRPSP